MFRTSFEDNYKIHTFTLTNWNAHNFTSTSIICNKTICLSNLMNKSDNQPSAIQSDISNDIKTTRIDIIIYP